MNAEHIEAYFSDELDANDRRHVEHLLENDTDLRRSFLLQSQIHFALEQILPSDASDPTDFDGAVMAHLESEAGGPRAFAKSVLTEIVQEREGVRPVRPLRWPDLITAGAVAAAACIALLFVLQKVDLADGNSADVVSTSTPEAAYLARIERSRDLSWSESSKQFIHEDGWIGRGLLEIESGDVTIALNSGATITVEGPAQFSLESTNRAFLNRGNLAAEVPPAASGFTVNTPRLNVVDIGTRFGVRVASDGDSELHVMEGEVRASRSSGNTVSKLLREGSALRADDRTRSGMEAIPYAGDRFVLQSGRIGAPLPDLHYSFDESTGAVLVDSGSHDQPDIPLVATGELENSPRRSAGKTGGGLVFTSGDSLTLPLPAGGQHSAPHTLAFWIKIPPRIDQEVNKGILRFGNDEMVWELSCNLNPNYGAKGALSLASGEGFIVGSSDIADGNWHHVACRFIGGPDAELASHVHLFVDGVQETISSARSTEIGSRSSRFSTQFLTIGQLESTGFAGWIDEVHFFTKAVSTPALQALSNE